MSPKEDTQKSAKSTTAIKVVSQIPAVLLRTGAARQARLQPLPSGRQTVAQARRELRISVHIRRLRGERAKRLKPLLVGQIALAGGNTCI